MDRAVVQPPPHPRPLPDVGRPGLDIRTLRRENPWYTTDSIGWTAQRPGLRVPDSVATPNLQESWEAWCSWRPEPEEIHYSQVHIVQPGEVLGTIARRYGVRIGELRTWNDLEGDLIRVGQSLTLLSRRPVRLPLQPHVRRKTLPTQVPSVGTPFRKENPIEHRPAVSRRQLWRPAPHQ